jgi:hydrogenase/urease accessory protein HupE
VPGTITPPPPEGGNVVVVVNFACAAAPKTITVRDNLFDTLGADYHTIANFVWSAGSQQFVFMPEARETRVAVASGEATRGVGSFFPLGIEHILTGYDHLLFLLALILRGGNLWSLFKIITAFTVAHSITLALAALNIVMLPERLVEATIALSIAYVAAENLFMRKAVSHRWAVSFLFGLVHGFGFSNVLRELGLPKQGLIWCLLNFNLGVEAGQATAVLIAVPLLFWLRKFKWEPRAVAATSILVLAVGLMLFVERALFPG